MSDISIVNTMKNTVSITQFTHGLAGKIFAEVKKYGAKVVMKNNTPECVLLYPEEYKRMGVIASNRIPYTVTIIRLIVPHTV